MTDYTVLTQLGQPKRRRLPHQTQALLERVPSPQPGRSDVPPVRLTAPEFTSAVPDHRVNRTSPISCWTTCPDAWIVESKSLKLYLASFRNHGAFHEACTMQVAQRIVERCWHRDGCESARIGIHAAAYRSTCFGRPARRLRGSGFPIRAWLPYRGRG